MLMLLATFGRERKPRVTKPDDALWKWTKAWANRWWLVDADNADCARDLIARADGELFDVRVQAPRGRIVSCGRHGPGGPARDSAPRSKAAPAKPHQSAATYHPEF